jgi:hypothetical protein
MTTERYYSLERFRSRSPEFEESGTYFLHLDGFNAGDGFRCGKCGRPLSMLAWLPPFDAELETWGRKFGDIVHISGLELLLSGRFMDLYRAAGLRGLEDIGEVNIVKVRSRRRIREPLPRYYKARVARSKATVDQVASEYKWEHPEKVCDVCGWNGKLLSHGRTVLAKDPPPVEDIFYPRTCVKNYVVSSRFRDLCITNGIGNVVFEPL